MSRQIACTLALATALALAGCSASNESRKEAQSAPAAAKPEKAPDVYHVQLDTSKGPIDLEIHRDWAPRGADHFYELVSSGFFDDSRFFRVVRDFVVQFGINGDPQTNQLWSAGALPDDPPKEHNVKGTLTFATRGPNTRTTQLFINLADNRKSLDGRGFTPIGKVAAGMDVVESLYSFYGDMPPAGQGPDPSLIQQQGNSYLENRFPRLDFIKKAVIR
jgi:peptidyl-prolyl cis-trans isomerase A (cyclophilin A)